MFKTFAQPYARAIRTAVGASGAFILSAALGHALLAAESRVSTGNPATAAATATARDFIGPAAVVQLTKQGPAKIVVDPPLAEQLSNGLVVVQYRTENLRVLPVFGSAALAVSPRIGHLHVTVDDAPWVWGVWHGTNGGELVLSGFPKGPHKILIELVDANHKTLSRGAVEFEVPEPKAVEGSVTPPSPISAAKLIVDKPDASALAGGLALIHYRTENVQLLPVYGATAATLSPQVGHVHITVDDASWHWADATGQPVVVNGLPPGPHKILIELVDANHKTIAQELVKFNVPKH